MIADIAGRLPPTEACEALIEAALAAGGHDNVSVGVLHAAIEREEPAAGQTTRRLKILDPATGGTREIAIPNEAARHDG